MSDSLARAREIHEAADLPPWQKQWFEHNTYAALLNHMPYVQHHSYCGLAETNPSIGSCTCGLAEVAATLEARIKETEGE